VIVLSQARVDAHPMTTITEGPEMTRHHCVARLALSCCPLALLLVGWLAAVSPGVAAAAPYDEGLILSPPLTPSTQTARALASAAVNLPASVDLRADAPPVGDQGPVNSCAAWASDYTALGYWENRDGIGGGALEPMYTYSQLVGGQNVGTAIDANLNIAIGQGVDQQADYPQGNDDYRDLPTADETANATHWRLSGYQDLAVAPNAASTITQDSIEEALAGNEPVVIGIPIYNNFYDVTSADGGLYTGPEDGFTGDYHAVTALGYNASGLIIENSWGTGWGAGGFATLAWSFVNAYVQEASAVGDLVHVQPAIHGPASGLTGQTLSFSATATDSAALGALSDSYAWQIGPAGQTPSTYSGAGVSYRFPVAGIYDITVTTSDTLGQRTTVMLPVTITQSGRPTAKISTSPADLESVPDDTAVTRSLPISGRSVTGRQPTWPPRRTSTPAQAPTMPRSPSSTLPAYRSRPARP
jgi:hypothetical protein